MPINTDKILDYCDQIDGLTQQIRNEITTEPEPPEPPTDETVVYAGDDLQAALNAGGNLALEAGAAFTQPASYRVTVPGTSVTGKGSNRIESTNDHAFDIPINVDNLAFADIEVAGKANEEIQIGVNGTSQATVESAPHHIRFTRVRSVGHRGKRVFDVNAAHVEFHQCEVRDCYSPDNVDSQAICVLNAPGPVLVDGGYFEAAAENLMVGGDTMKIPGCRPTGITIRNATFTKPLDWKIAGTPKVKNLLELKDGEHVLIENCDFTNSWQSAQDGYGWVFTPSNGGSNLDVVARHCRMSNVAGICNVIGKDKSGINQTRTQVTISHCDLRTNKLENGGRGIFALIGAGPEWFIAEESIIRVDGTSFIDCYDKIPIDLLQIVNCDWNYPKYGIRIGGYSHGEDYYNVIGSIVIEGNVIRGAASSFKSRYPNNTYLESYRFSKEAEQIRKGVLPEDRAEYEGPPYRD